MMAHQVAGKASREGFFFNAFSVNDLPKGMMAAAATAILVALLFSRLLGWFGPRRVVPGAFLFSAVLHLVEWYLMGTAPKVAGLMAYLHIMGLGATLLSGFWSITNEAFDPSTAKRVFGRITGAGTLGSVVGPATVFLLPGNEVLLLMAGFHALTGSVLFLMPSAMGLGTGLQDEPSPSAAAVFKRAPYLLNMAVLVVLCAASASMIDFILKRGVTEEFGKGPEYFRFMSVFLLGTQLIGLFMQAFVTRVSLERFGIARNIASLPVGVAGISSLSLMYPAFPFIVGTRGLELILHGSLFRSAYELLYTPVAPAEKRVAKTIIDVGCDRAGDALGGGIATLMLAFSAQYVRNELLGFAVAISLVAAYIASRLDKVYTSVIEKRLVDHAIVLDMDSIQDSTTMSAVLRTIAVHQKLEPDLAKHHRAEATAVPDPEPLDDPILQRVQVLRSGNPRQISGLLEQSERLDLAEVPLVVRLLAWDEVAQKAVDALIRQGPRITGVLIDHLADAEQDFAIRRRIPRVLARFGSERAFQGLLVGLKDLRFEVRFQSARALDYMVRKNPSLPVNQDMILRAVSFELNLAPVATAARNLLDRPDGDAELAFLDTEVGERSDKRMELLFSLLATVLPREPLQVAFRAFHSGDRYLRGLALEYMEYMLPSDAVEGFRKLTASERMATATTGIRSRDEVFREMVRKRGETSQ